MKYLDSILEKIQYNEGDLRPKHDAIAALMIKDKKILMLDHVKYNFWTIPIGKVEPKQTIEQGLKQELKEEVNITPTDYKQIGDFKKSYMREGKKVTIHAYIFVINKWQGSVRNNEPKKHRSLKWMSLKEIKTKKISNSTKEALKYEKVLAI
jgi:8-oxo-dGTP pyrophosphatase MutT (NUDIX family)